MTRRDDHVPTAPAPGGLPALAPSAHPRPALEVKSVIPGILASAEDAVPVQEPLAERTALRLPPGNATHEPDTTAHYVATGLSEPLFAGDHSLLVSLEIPWYEIGYLGTEAQHILGTQAGTAPSAGQFNLRAERRANDAGQALQFHISNGAESRALALELPERAARLLIVIRRVAGTLEMAAFRDGEALATTLTGAGGFSGVVPAGEGMLLGRVGRGPGAPLTPDPEARGFTGMLGFVGYYEGVISDGQALAISEGRALQARTDPALWRFARRFAAPAPASLGPVAWATADRAPAWTLSGTATEGSDVVPAHDGLEAWLSLDPIVDGMVWAAGRAESAATVALSGRYDRLAPPLEARVIYPDGAVHLDWTTLSGLSLSGGLWQGTLEVPLMTGGYGHVEVRPAARPALVARSRALAGAGYKMALWGQSNVNTSLGVVGDASVAAANFAYASIDLPLSAPGSGNLCVFNIRPGRSWSRPWAGMAEEWQRHSQIPLLVVDESVNGTSPAELQDDNNAAKRRWSDVERAAAVLGGSLTAHMVSWEPTATNPEELDALIFGDPAGVTYPIDHYLSDGAPYAARDLVIARTDGVLEIGVTFEFDSSFNLAPNGYFQELYQVGAAYMDYAEAQGGAVTPLGLDRPREGGHTLEPDSSQTDAGWITLEAPGWASERGAVRYIAGFARLVGANPEPDPTISGIAMSGDDRTAIFTVDLPNGGALQTLWSLEGQAPPAGESPVQGFEWWEPGAPSPSRLGITAAISGTDELHVTRNDGQPFLPGTEFFFHPGLANHGNAVDNGLALYRGFPRESGGYLRGAGLAVVPRRYVTNWMVPRPFDLGGLFAGGAEGDYWLVDDAASLSMVGGGAPIEGGQVSAIAGQRGALDIAFSNPAIYRLNGGFPYLELPPGTTGLTASAVDYPEVLILMGAQVLAPAPGSSYRSVFGLRPAIEWFLRANGPNRNLVQYNVNQLSSGGSGDIVGPRLGLADIVYDRPAVLALRAGSSLPATHGGFSINRHEGAFKPIPSVDLTYASGPQPFTLNFEGSHHLRFWGGVLCSDPGLVGRREIGALRLRLGRPEDVTFLHYGT